MEKKAISIVDRDNNDDVVFSLLSLFLVFKCVGVNIKADLHVDFSKSLRVSIKNTRSGKQTVSPF